MGRFYKTSKGEHLDFIYQQPKNLLMQAVQVADSQVAQQEAKVADLYGRLKFNALTPDTTRRDEIIEGYKSQIDELSEKIRANPLDFRKDTPIIRGLSDKIKDDMERGEIAAIESNYATRKEYEDKLNEQVKAKLIPATEKSQLLSNYDSKFKEAQGTLYKGVQDYNPYSTGYVAENVDMFKIVDDRLTGMMATGSEKWGWNLKMKEDGKYLVTDKKSGEVVSEDRVRNAVRDILSTDSSITEALGTRMKENIQGYDAESVTAKLTAAEDYAMMKFPYEKTKHDGSVKTDDYYKAGFDDNLKNKYIPTNRNEDAVAYSNLYGGAKTYTEAQTNADSQKGLFQAKANLLIGDAQQQLLKKNGLTIDYQGNVVADPTKTPLGNPNDRILNYKNSMNALQQQFEVAKTTGNFKGVQDVEKTNGITIDKDNFNAFQQGWTPTIVADLNNWETKKAAIAKGIKNKNPSMTSAQVEAETARVLNDPKYNTNNNTIFESQEVTHYDKVKEGQYVGWLNREIGGNPIDFMLGKGGKLLIQGSQGQGGTATTSDFNKLTQADYLQFSQTAREDFARDANGNILQDENGRNIVQKVGWLGGKEVRMTKGKVFHTYEDIPGMKDGYKYKQRFTFTDPATGEVIEASMLMEEDKIPLPEEYRDLRDQPEQVIVAKAGKILTLATQNNQNLVSDGLVDKADAVTNVAEVPGLKVQALGGGQAAYIYTDTKGTIQISEQDALKVIKRKLANKMPTSK